MSYVLSTVSPIKSSNLYAKFLIADVPGWLPQPDAPVGSGTGDLAKDDRKGGTRAKFLVLGKSF